MPSYWLIKSEPDVFSIDDLAREGGTCWEGVRNYQARNNMIAMEIGDLVLYYHSNAKPPAVVGVARVSKTAYPDHFAWDSESKYFDPKATAENPRWQMVDVEFEKKLPVPVPLDVIKATPDLSGMVLVNNSRLSVQPVSSREFALIVRMGR